MMMMIRIMTLPVSIAEDFFSSIILLIFVLSIFRFVRDLKIDVYLHTAHEKGKGTMY